MHPDVIEFAPGGASYRVKEDVRDTILPEAARAPIEADRRVLILFEAERLRGNQNESANAMLKTIEEPPPRTIVLLVTAAADDLLPTIRSRCQRIDFDPVADDTLQAALEREGVSPEIAATAAALSGGQLARARAFAGPLAPMRVGVRRRAARGSTAPARRAFAVAEMLGAAVDHAADAVTSGHDEELRDFDAELERLGYDERDAHVLAPADRGTPEARGAPHAHRSVARRRDRARDRLPRRARPTPRRRSIAIDRALVVSPRAAASALDVCRDACEAFLINEKGLVRLTHLLLSLPSARPA